MKATKKIVGAACALVAAVALSAGSTYAWFSANNSVKADGMSVSAVAPANLLIAEGYKSSITDVNKSSIQMALPVEEMWPAAISTTEASGTTLTEGSATATALGTGNKLYAYDAKFDGEGGQAPTGNNKGTPSGYTKLDDGTVSATGFKWTTKNGTKDANDASLVGVESKNYVAGYNMTIGNMAQTVDVDATITISWTGDDNTNKFVRAGLIISSIQGTSTGSTVTYSFYSAPNTTAATGTSLEFKYAKILEDFADKNFATVTLLVWFDGNDADCYVTNASVKATLNATVTYTAVAKPASGG